MGTRGLLCFLVVCLVLSNVSGFDILKTMKDLLEKVKFGKSVPRAGLLLLCWLLGQGKIDNNGKLQLNFDPTHQLYGFHQYNNYEKTFPVLSNTNYAYYSLGNLNSQCARTQLPEFITQDFKNYPGHRQRNIDRIIIRIDQGNPRVVDEVYITQHYDKREKGSDYDPNLTFMISTKLLKIIEELCNPDNNNNKKRDREDPDNQRLKRIKVKFANDPPLSFLYEAGYDTGKEYKQHSKYSYYRSYRHSELEGTSLELQQMPTGLARIMWSSITDDMMESDLRVYIYKENEETPLLEYPLDGRTCGAIDTAVPLTPGLRIGLKKAVGVFKIDDANWVSPTPIKGYEASVQLFVKNGLACARLYIAKSFDDWKNVFQNSWMGFYTSDDANKHNTYQWITNLIQREPSDEFDSEHYNVYEYESNLYMSHGVQLRFMLDKDVVSERARTEPWEIVEVPQSFFTWTKVFDTLIIIVIVGVFAANRLQQQGHFGAPAPHIVQVSHGRPGF